MNELSKPRTSNKRGIYLLIVLSLIVYGLAGWIYVNRQSISDNIVVFQHGKDPKLKQFADKTSMTDNAKFLLYASRAQVSAREQFNTNCSGLVERTVVLGCYTNQRIYVYDIEDSRLNGIEEVTMAHEMLHAGYDRLSVKERQLVDAMIEKQYSKITDERFKRTVALYPSGDSALRNNELHSMLATEIRTLSPELEAYYKKYFIDRSLVVNLAEAYESTFRQLEDQQRAIIDEMKTISAELETRLPSYENATSKLSTDIDLFNSRSRTGYFTSNDSFNKARADLLARQDNLENERIAINSLIDRHQQLQTELEKLNLRAQELQKSIDSLPSRTVPAL